MTTIAKLDKQSRLIGLKKLGKRTKVPEGAIVVEDECDLPHDASYYWHKGEKCFMPVGHGHGRPGPSPLPTEMVVLFLAKAMPNPPQEVLDWIKWVEDLDKP